MRDPLESVQILALNQMSDFSKLDDIPPASIAALLKARNNGALVKSAVSALGRMQAKELAPQLLILLSDPNSDVRAAVASALGQMRAHAQAPQLLKLLSDPDYGVRTAAASALGQMQAKELVPQLSKLLVDPGYGVRSAAVYALGQMQAKEQAYQLLKLLSDPDSRVRSSTAVALGRMQAEEQAPQLSKLLSDPDSGVRSSAAYALGQMQAKDQKARLLESLSDPNQPVRDAAIYALVQIQAKELVPKLLKSLSDPDSYIRSSSVSALGEMQAKKQAPQVFKLLLDSNDGVRRASIYSLRNMQANDEVPELLKLLSDPNPLFRGTAASALGQLQAKEQAPQLLKLLSDPNPDVRSAAASALGQMQAKEQVPQLLKLLSDPDSGVRAIAASALSQTQAKEQAPQLLKLLSDPDSGVRSAAASALGQLQAKEEAPQLLKLLSDPDSDVRRAAVSAISQTGPVSKASIYLLTSPYYANHDYQAQSRFLCHYLTGGDQSIELVLKRLMFTSDQQPVPIASAKEARDEIHAFAELMPSMKLSKDLELDADRQILQVVREWKGARTEADDAELTSLGKQMSPDSAQLLQSLITEPWWQVVLQKTWKPVALQAALWALLIWIYPRSPWIQALFFWNRGVRKVFGLLYVDLFLTFIPFLRERLLSPFKEDLEADARLQDKTLEDYFPDVEVQESATNKRVLIREAIPAIRGQIILEGESGVGKSTALRLLVRNARSPVVYLPASSCEQGVFEAIQARLKGKASDEQFLKTVIWSGGLSVIVDGLNEVTVETRERVQRFLIDYPKAHVLLATQPLRWTRPPKARVFQMVPLSENCILAFLQSRYPTFADPKITPEDAYGSRCRKYLDDVLAPSQSAEDRSNALFVLSNPMDLTTVALMLASGEWPTLEGLQDQQFNQMARDYKRNHPGEEVPLLKFSESVYEARLRDDAALPVAEFFPLIQEMVSCKMALEQSDIDASKNPIKKWVFRHDKVRDYFLMQAFLAAEERIPKHIDDPRFRGVYLLLASRLPLDVAKELKETLVDRAAETKDHHLSDSMVEILRARRSKAAVELTKAATSG